MSKLTPIIKDSFIQYSGAVLQVTLHPQFGKILPTIAPPWTRSSSLRAPDSLLYVLEKALSK